jgi:hypothetical protein
MRKRTLCFVAAAVLGVATVAGAQVPDSFHDLQASLHGGERLRITDETGRVTNGRLMALSDQSLRLLIQSGQVDVSASSVVRIEHVRSRAGKGALVGLIGGAVAGVVAIAATPECQGICIGPSKESVILPAAGLFGGIGAGIGALIGAAKPAHRLIYVAPRQTPSLPDLKGHTGATTR